jgi:N,N'-diacetyllegionaminate synthase
MKKITIIAEIGINHNGSVALAKRMVKSAKKCGANVVKFQNAYMEDLFIVKSKSYKGAKKYEFNEDNFKEIKKYCDKLKIEFLSTPYDLRSVDLLEKLNVKRYKVASADVVDMPLHKKIISTRKPVIISVGMANINEIKKTINFYKKKKMNKITLLHCVSSYPCTTKSLNLKVMLKLQKIFNLPIGYSDHSIGNEAAIMAVGYGAKIIEKHFTINKKLTGADHKVSDSPKEFVSFVKAIREAEIRLGSEEKKCQPEEKKFIRFARKSITIKNYLKKGAKIKETDIIMKRPGTGLDGQKINTVIGKKIKRDLKKDYQIRKTDLR